MSLGVRNTSHYFPNQREFAEPTRKTLTPLRTWDIKSGFTDRALSIEEAGGMMAYSTQSHFTVKKDPYVTIHAEKHSNAPPVAGVTLDGQGAGSYRITLGDPQETESGVSGAQECKVVTGGNVRNFEHRFEPPGEQKAYAWRDTNQYEISIADSKVETTGRDWKFISLTPEGEEDELLAAFVHHSKAPLRNKSTVFWFADVSREVELWGLASVVGLVERNRKSKDKWNFTAMVGAGAVM